jgi:regulator of sigma E protease
MLAGVFVNIILGIFIFWMLTLKLGETYTPNADAKYGIVAGTVGQKMGLRTGDRIYAVNDIPVVRFDDLTSADVLLNNSVLNIQRGNQKLNLTVPANILNDLSDHGIEQFINRDPRFKFDVDSVMAGSNAQKAGLTKGDSIIAVNAAPIAFYDELQAELQKIKGKPAQLTIKRNGNTQQLNAQVTKEGTIGFYAKRPKLVTVKYGFFASLPIGAAKAWGTFTDDAKSVFKIFKGDVKFSKAVQGPVAIAGMFGSEVNWIKFWSLVGLLSMVLAFTNLLPIPALDGGHSVFLLVEMIKGKPLSDKFLERSQIVGFVLLITLMVFVFGNDILRLITKH